LGVTDARISGSPGISSELYQRRYLPNAFGRADGHDPALRDRSILGQAAISLMPWLTLLASAD
jgi:hypothetical protein